MNIKRSIITVGLAIIAVVLLVSCDESSDSYIGIVNFTEGVADDSGLVYLDVTAKNFGNGSAREVSCLITVTETRSDTVLTETTALFSKGMIIEPDEEVTERVQLLYSPATLDALIEYEEVTNADGTTEKVPLEPIIDRQFEFSWEEVQ